MTRCWQCGDFCEGYAERRSHRCRGGEREQRAVAELERRFQRRQSELAQREIHQEMDRARSVIAEQDKHGHDILYAGGELRRLAKRS